MHNYLRQQHTNSHVRAKFEVRTFSVFAFNAPNLRVHEPFRKKFRGYVRTFLGSTRAKIDVHIFSHFEAIKT